MDYINQNETTYFRNLPEDSPVSEIHLRVIQANTPNEKSFKIKLQFRPPAQKFKHSPPYSLVDTLSNVLPIESDYSERDHTLTFSVNYLEELFGMLSFLKQRDIITLPENDMLLVCAMGKLKSANRSVYAYHYETHKPPKDNWIESQRVDNMTHLRRHQSLALMYRDYRDDVNTLLAESGRPALRPHLPAKPDILLPPFSEEQHTSLVQMIVKAGIEMRQGNQK